MASTGFSAAKRQKLAPPPQAGRPWDGAPALPEDDARAVFSPEPFAAQKITAGHKQVTFVRPGYFLKGPYAADSPKLPLIFGRYAGCRALGDDTVVEPLPFRAPGGQIYVRTASVAAAAAPPPAEWAVESRQPLDKFGRPGIELRVVSRASLGVGKVSNLMDSDFAAFARHCFLPAVKHLVARAVQSAGDSGFHNIVYATSAPWRVAGIDLEEIRSSEPAIDAGVWSLLLHRPPAARHAAGLDGLLARHRAELAEFAAAAHARLDCAKSAAISAAFRAGAPPPPPAPAAAPAAGGGGGGAATALPGLMSLRYRQERTAEGVPVDVAKSAMQKAIRRGDAPRALAYALQLHRMGGHTAEDGRSGAGIRTNMFNRLLVTAGEDVCVANIHATLRCFRLLLDRRADNGLSVLRSVVWDLCSSQKSRYPSWIFSASTRPEGRALCGDDYADTPEAAGAETPIGALKARLAQGSKKAVYWAAKFFAQYPKSLPPVSREAGPYFEAIGHYAPAGDMALYRRAYDDRRGTRDAKVFWILPLLAVLLCSRERPDSSSPMPADFAPIEISGMDQVRREDPHAIDIHTALGRREQSTKYAFAKEGAAVANEVAVSDDDARLKDIYERAKM